MTAHALPLLALALLAGCASSRPEPVPEIRPGFLQGYLSREAMLNSLTPASPTSCGRFGGIRSRRGRRPKKPRAARDAALGAGRSRCRPPLSGGCGNLLLRAGRADLRRSDAIHLSAAAPHAHGRRPLDLRRQGPLQAHATVRREPGGDLHAGREGRLVSLGPNVDRLGMGAGPERGRARARRRAPGLRRGVRREPQRLQRPLEQRRRSGPDDRRRSRRADACRAGVPRRRRSGAIRSDRHPCPQCQAVPRLRGRSCRVDAMKSHRSPLSRKSTT